MQGLWLQHANSELQHVGPYPGLEPWTPEPGVRSLSHCTTKGGVQGILRKGASSRWKCLAKMAHPLASCPLPHLHGVHQEYSWEEKGCTPPPYLCLSELSLLSHSSSDEI